MPLKIRAFSGFRKSGFIEPGWKATNAAFFVSVFRNQYGDDFTYADLQDFKRGNNIEDWEPRDDLLADGTLVAEDGDLYIPDGFDTKGWAPLYQQWKNGNSIATPPTRPAPAYEPPPAPAPAPEPVNAGWDNEDYSTSWIESQPAPQSQTSFEPAAQTPQPAAQPQTTGIVPASYSPAPNSQTAASAKKSDTDYMPLILLGGAAAVLFMLSGKSAKRTRRK